LKTILPLHYKDIKPCISPCGKNTDEVVMENTLKIFGPKEETEI
jgi:hypothetical protein